MIQYDDKELRSRGVIWCSWEGPTRGVDTHSGDTKLTRDHVPFIQNMNLPMMRPEGVNGYSLLDTTFDASDDATPFGFGQWINLAGTERFILLQADGSVQRWDAAANAVVQLAAAGILPTTAGTRYDVQQYEDYLIFTHPTDNWKYDGTDFLPLGARIINNAEATTDWALTGTGQTGLTTSATAAFGTLALTSDAMLASETATLTYDPAGTIEDAGLLLARDYLESDRIGFWFRTTDASTIDTTNTLVRIETSSGNDFDIAASAWTDEDGTTITLADNTWHRIEVQIDSGTEAGTFDMTSVDNIHFVIATNGTGGMTWFIDQLYWRYSLTTTMPGSTTCAVWNNVFFGAGSTADPSQLYFALAGGPDQYDALANIDVNADDGYTIRGIRRFFNQLFIGKGASIHSLGGSLTGTVYPNYNFEIVDVTEEHGVDGFRSIVVAHNNMFFPWKNRIYEYNGTGTRPIANLVLPDLADFEETLVGQKTAAYYKRQNQIWLAYPGNGDTNNARRVRLDLENKGFIGIEDDAAALNLNILLTVTESDRERLVGIDEAGDVMNLDDPAATDFDGTAIVRIFRLPWDAAGIEERVKYWGDLLVQFGAQSSGTVSVRYRVAEHPREMDTATFVEAGTVDLAAADTLGWVQISEVSRWIQIEFRTSAVQFDLQYPIRWEAVPLGRWS